MSKSGNRAPPPPGKNQPDKEIGPPVSENKKPQNVTIRKSSYCREGKMTEGEAPEKVQRANDVRWKECAKMAKVERKLAKRLREDPGQRPVFSEPIPPINLPERPTLEWWGTWDLCKAPDCGTCGSCQGVEPRATRARSRGIGANVQEPCEAEQIRCVNWPETPPLPQLSFFFHGGRLAQ